MSATLIVRLLGQFSLIKGTTALAGLQTERQQSLLAYLILLCRVPQPRRQIAFQLWPDSAEAQARTNLRHLLHQLHCTFPALDRYLWSDGQALQWRPQAPVCLDVTEFEEAAAASRYGEAASLYQGDLLPHCYDEWILLERDRLQQLYASVLEQLIEQLEAERNYRAAVTYAQRLLRLDSLREAPYRHLMRLHALSGDRAAALRTYHACAAELQRELAVAPSRLTREAYERLLQDGQPVTARLGASPP